MKLNKMGRGALASILSLAVGLGVTACSRDYTLAYVYVTTAQPLSSASTAGGVSAFSVDYQSGSLIPLSDSPIPAGKNPVAIAAAPNGKFLYVVNHDDSTVMLFAIGTDGKLYNQQTINVTGSFPTSVAIDAGGNFLYVAFTYQLGPTGQQLYSPASPGPGGVTIFPITTTDTTQNLGTPTTVNVGNTPVAIAVSRPTPTGGGSYVFVVDQEIAPAKATVLAFAQNATTGAMTPSPGTAITVDTTGKTVATGYGAGTTPSAIAVDPSSRFVYITDQATNQLYGNLVGTGGALVPMVNGPFNTGVFPVGVTVDPRGKFLYVANFTSGTVGAYAIDLSTGTPVGSIGSASTSVDTAPTCVAVDPALGKYAYTSNNLAGTVDGLQLDTHNGGLTKVQNTSFPASAKPTCLVAVANGSHPSELINP
jgi:6-phosphogluconolactonase